MNQFYQGFLIRDWQRCDPAVPRQRQDRTLAANVIRQVLEEYGLPWQPEAADRDVIEVESAYLQVGGEFWVVESQKQVVGTAAYYPISKGHKAVEIRKMYLLPEVRGKGLGKYLLHQLETTIRNRGFKEIWIETASVLKEAVCLYEKYGYEPVTEVETKRCDLAYLKKL